MGCNLGPNQAARHLSNGVTPHQLSYVNQRHMGLEQLDSACRDLTYLNGIQLMPRIRNWKDLRFYKAEKGGRYKHIDRLFSDVIDWQLIRNHWKDLMQVAISIQSGRVMSPMLLRKLSHEGRHNRLFAAARELGRVLRTVYLLRWISQKECDRKLRRRPTRSSRITPSPSGSTLAATSLPKTI